MIQRIQTVYLGLATLVLLALFFFPVATFLSDLTYLELSLPGLKSLIPNTPSPFPAWFTWPLVLIDLLTAGLCALAIFRFKNRTQQVKLTNVAMLANIVLIAALLFLYSNLIERKTGITPDYTSGIGVYLPLVSLVFIILANRAIKRDDAMVRSADRLR